MTIQMKAIEKYFHVVLFIILYKVVLTLERTLRAESPSIFPIFLGTGSKETLLAGYLECGHSNESYRAVLSCGTV